MVGRLAKGKEAMSNKAVLETLKTQASEAVANSKFEEARSYFIQALAIENDSADLHYGLATSCFVLGDLMGAVRHFKEVTRLDPLRAGAFVNLGAVHNRLGQYEDAIASLRRGIQLDPKRGEGYYNLGIVYRQKGQLDLAIQAYREATRVSPRMADAHYNLANIYMERQDFSQAATHYRHAVEIRPTWEKAVHGLEVCQSVTETVMEDEVGGEPTRTSGKATPTSIPDPHRFIDPVSKGIPLRDLHHLMIDLQTEAHELQELAQKEIDASIRDLSNAILFPHNTQFQLGKQIAKLEDVIQTILRLKASIQRKVDQSHDLENTIIE